MEEVVEEGPPPVVKDKFQCVLEALELSPLQRDPHQIAEHLSWFRQRCDVLSSMPNDKLADVLQSVDLKRVRKDQIVVRQGNEGNWRGISFQKKEDDGKLYGVPEEGHVIDPIDRIRLGTRIRPLLVGNSFGEVVLTSDMTRRTASVVVDEPCVLAVFNRELYNRYFDYSQNREWKEKSTFVESCPFLKGWTVTYKHLFAENITVQTILYGNPIIKQGEPADRLFFVSKGQFKVMLDPLFSSRQYKFMDEKQNSAKPKLATSDFRKALTVSPQLRPLTVYEKRQQRKYYGYVACERRHRNHNIHVTTVGGPMALIGDMEVILDIPTYTASAYCTQEVKLYSMEKQNFFRIVAKRNPETYEIIKSLALQKLKSRAARYPDIPVYRKMMDVYNSLLNSQNQKPAKREKRKPQLPGKAATMAVHAFKRGTPKGSKRVPKDTTKSAKDPQISTMSNKTDVEAKSKKEKMNADGEAKKNKYSVADYRELKKKLQARGKSISTNIFS